MKSGVKKGLIGVGCVLGIASLGMGGFVFSKTSAFDESMAKVYDVAPLAITASPDPAVIARGKHLVDAVTACSSKDCHGNDLAGGTVLKIGPIGTFTAPNITPGGILAVYKDGEIARLIRHGVKKDGRSVTFMPARDFNWLNDKELTAIVSYLRTVPKVDKPNGPVQTGTLGKVLDRKGDFPIDMARKIKEEPSDLAGDPTPDAAYGKYLGRMCTGCHGETLSGGPLPGAPKDLPIPENLTPHESGLKGWSYDDFNALLTKGQRKDNRPLNPFMPTAAFGQMDDTEKHALFAYLQALPPKAFGGR